MRRKKIMILYASYGDGHLQVSRALQEHFAHNGDHELIMIDLFQAASPWLNKITRYLYIKSFTILPMVYGMLYYSTNTMRENHPLLVKLNRYGSRALKALIELHQPDVVINTFPALAMPELRQKERWSIPICTIMTDFTIHQRWLHPQVDRFYVAHEDLMTQLCDRGIPRERITVSGIPLKSAFKQVEEEANLLEQHGLRRDRKTILIMAGAQGVLQNIRRVCRALLMLPGVQVIVICGRNESLRKDLLASMPPDAPLLALGFEHRIHAWMRAADCIVTKPGGITLTEALQTNLPIYIHRPVPGQEKDNALYLEGKGAARISYKTQELIEQLRAGILNESIWQHMRLAATHLRKQDASERVVQDILQHIDIWKQDIPGGWDMRQEAQL